MSMIKLYIQKQTHKTVNQKRSLAQNSRSVLPKVQDCIHNCRDNYCMKVTGESIQCIRCRCCRNKKKQGMNIPPVDLLRQVQGGNVYAKYPPIRSYEDAVMATAFMPGMFNEGETVPEFKPRIREKTVSPVKKEEVHKNSSTDSEMEQKHVVTKSVPKYGKKAQSYRLSKSMFDRIKLFKKNTGEGVVHTFSEPDRLNAVGLSTKSMEIVTKPTETDI